MQKLPFNLFVESAHPSFKLGDLEIPSYGSLTPNEAIALMAVEVSEGEPVGAYYAKSLEIVITSRTDAGVTAKDLYDVPATVLEQGMSWIKSEGRQWEPDTKEDEEKKPPTGQQSSGGSSSDIPTTQDSQNETSETAQST